MTQSNNYSAKVNDLEGYFNKNDDDRRDILESLYKTENLSWIEISKLLDTYPNKIRRDAKKLGISSKTKSEAQKYALKSGRHTHPTKGKNHSEESKRKISNSTAEVWDNLTDDEKELRRLDAKRRWDERDDKEEFIKKGILAVRESSKTGSKLEKVLQHALIKNGYKAEFHKEQWVIRTKLQIDIWLPELNVAIEVDGPSHWDDIWGEDKLIKNQIRDSDKDGILVGRGCIVIRVRQKKKLSNKFERDITKKLLDKIREIEKDRTKIRDKVIVIE